MFKIATVYKVLRKSSSYWVTIASKLWNPSPSLPFRLPLSDWHGFNQGKSVRVNGFYLDSPHRWVGSEAYLIHVKLAVYIWHMAKATAVFPGDLFLINRELSFWNDESVQKDIWGNKRWSSGKVMLAVFRIHFAFFWIITLITCN